MKRLFHTLLSSFIAATILIVGPMGHVSAMQSHGGMNHGGPSNMSEHCTMLCTSANPTKENKNKDDTPDDDDTPSPFIQVILLKNRSSHERTIHPKKCPNTDFVALSDGKI
jgi:hypothetical protein